jgi:fructose-specific phosphotransferase system IIC component
MGMLSMILAARPWFAWIPFVLVASAVLGILSMLLGYYVKVTSNKHPRD